MEFDSTKHKIEKSFELEDQNRANIKSLKRVDLFGRPQNTLKKIITLPLITGYDFQNGSGGTFSDFFEVIATGGHFGPFSLWLPRTLEFAVHLTNFPEWAIPMTKLVPVISLDDAWDKSQVTITTRFQYWWRKIDDTTWDLYGQLFVAATIEGHTSPGQLISLYTDLDLVVINENIWQEVDTTKS